MLRNTEINPSYPCVLELEYSRVSIYSYGKFVTSFNLDVVQMQIKLDDDGTFIIWVDKNRLVMCVDDIVVTKLPNYELKLMNFELNYIMPRAKGQTTLEDIEPKSKKE